MNQYEKNILAHVEAHGCSVTSVFDPDREEPPFSYSIGIARSAGAPELIIVGLASKIAHGLINDYNERVRAGETFVPGKDYPGFIKGFPVQFVPVAREHRAAYMRSTCWLHDGPDFDALQLVWPSSNGAWPWDANAGTEFGPHQPLLSRSDPSQA